MFIQLDCIFFPFHGSFLMFHGLVWSIEGGFRKLESNVLGNVVKGDLLSMGSQGTANRFLIT